MIAILGVGAVAAVWIREAPDGATPVEQRQQVVAPVASDSGTRERTLIVATADGILDALIASGVASDQAQRASAEVIKSLPQGGGEVTLTFSLAGPERAASIGSLQASLTDGSSVIVRTTPDGFSVQRRAAKLDTRIKVVRGEMDGESFYTSAVSAGVTDSLISEFAAAFSFDFNFQTEVGPGDIFEAAFEQVYTEAGQMVGQPQLHYVSLSTAAKSRSLYRFTPPGESQASWFDGNGKSIVRSLMRTPIDGARITSKFGPRFHPVLRFDRMHNGTDFAAPTGTAIYASGDAIVQSAGMKGANGNMTILRHDNGWLTYYLHQDRFMPGIEPGARVRQGQKIGEVGTTGRSTGPHLHYEVRIDGQPVDPMRIDTGNGVNLSGSALAAFRKERDRIDAARAGG